MTRPAQRARAVIRRPAGNEEGFLSDALRMRSGARQHLRRLRGGWSAERQSRGGRGEGAHAPWRLLRRGGGAGGRGGGFPPFSGAGAGAALSATSAGEAG